MALTQLYGVRNLVHSNLSFADGREEVFTNGATRLAGLEDVTLERDGMKNGHTLNGRIASGVLASNSFPKFNSPVYALVGNGIPGLRQGYARRAMEANKDNSWLFVGDGCYKDDLARVLIEGEFEIVDERDRRGEFVFIPFDPNNRYLRLLAGGKGTPEEKTARVKNCIKYWKSQKPKQRGIELFVPQRNEVVSAGRDIIATQLWAGGVDCHFRLGGDQCLDRANGVFGCVGA